MTSRSNDLIDHRSPDEPGEPGPLIGMRLRREREARRLALVEVAERAGLTKSFLSRVERDQVSPSLSSLFGICRALGIEISELLAVPQTRVIRAVDRTKLSGLPGANVIDTLITPNTQRHVTVLETVCGPGATAGDAYYSLASEFEVCFVLEGAVQFDVEGDVFSLKVGDALSFGASTPHRWQNPSQTKGARFLSVLAPALPDALTKSTHATTAPPDLQPTKRPKKQ
jgi:transcriptional regulator with XRE-family HTH domain